MSTNSAFKERLYKDYDLRGRVRLSLILSMIFYPGFLILDAIYTPNFFKQFLTIRLIVIALNGLLLYRVRPTKSVRGLLNLGMGLLIIDAAGIAVMVQMMEGFKTSYYQGLTLIIMCMMVLLPFALLESAIVSATVWLAYVIPSLFRIRAGNLDWPIVVNNLFFLTSIVVIGAFASYIMDNIRRREIRSRIQLEEMTQRLQESNAKLKMIDEFKTQFFANVNHELRTPLTLMLTPLAPMLEEKLGPVTAGQRDTIETIRRNGYQLLKLINNLLDLTKLEAGKMRLKIKSVEFIEYAGSFLTTIKPLADRKNINLYFQHPPHKVDVTLDPDQFEKVIMNILSNAAKFTPEGGRITVYIEDRARSVVLTVEDTGPGIPKDMLEVIFDRFSQVDGSLSRSHEGTGIGLSLAREIVNLHGGRIRAESDYGRGSRFVVTVLKGTAHFTDDVIDRRMCDQPVSIHKRATDVEQPRVQDIVVNSRELQLADLERIELPSEMVEPEKKHERQILVIDDNPEVLKLMKLLLSDEFDLDFATSAAKGLTLLRDHAPDIVLCDVMMPEMDGHAFCRQVKNDEMLKHTPVILVTARSGVEMLAEGIESGADDYIAKPFNATELKARIRSLLRIRCVEAELALANRNLKMRTGDLVERQRSLFIAMVKSLVSALEAKDVYTRHHSARVTEFTLKIARKMGLSERELADLELAALLHDVGKIAVPEWVLNKKGKLTEEEFAFIKSHPKQGESILSPVIELNQISKTVRAHHERYNGTGYPDGLKGLEIPLGARIMAVADAYDSITSERPYRGAESHSYAMKEITRSSGTQFDPEVVQHFIELSREFAEKRENKADPGRGGPGPAIN